MASQLAMGSSVVLPKRCPAFRPQQQSRAAAMRPATLGNSMLGGSTAYSSTAAAFGMPSSSSRTANRRVVTMAAKVTGKIKLELVAGKANPSPPVGPALGAKGVNIMAFCKDYNAQTAKMAGDVVPVEITVYEDRSFTFILKTPPTAVLLKKAAGISSGSGKSKEEKVGKVTKAQVEEIAKRKLPDTNATKLESACKMVEGTARSLGLVVVD